MISEKIISFYDKIGLSISEFQVDKESKIYEACTFKLNQKFVIYRTGKTTPTKVGLFVTIWKRDKQGITAPFDVNDNFDFIIVNCERDNLIGQFIFPKSVLLNQKIISGDNSNGKRGVRVYPPWDIVDNKQALKTQEWQAKYFFDFSNPNKVDLTQIKQLLKT